MIEEIIDNMLNDVKKLQESIKEDLDDVKAARHEDLLKRNDEKHYLIDEITQLKASLNQALIDKMNEGVDVNIYREKVDALENELRELYELNKELASIVLPVQQMYKDLVDEITAAKGGSLFDVKA